MSGMGVVQKNMGLDKPWAIGSLSHYYVNPWQNYLSSIFNLVWYREGTKEAAKLIQLN